MKPAGLLRCSFIVTTLLVVGPALGQGILLGSLGGAAVGTDDAGAIVTIDQTTGEAIVLRTPIPGVALPGLASDSAGRLFAVTDRVASNQRLIEVDPEDRPADSNDRRPIARRRPGHRTRHYHPAQHGRHSGSAVEGGGLERDDLVTVDRSTAQVTFVGTPNFVSSAFVSIAFAADGTLWAKEGQNGSLWSLDPVDASVITTAFTNPIVGAGDRDSVTNSERRQVRSGDEASSRRE